MYTSYNTCIYIYIYRERERKRVVSYHIIRLSDACTQVHTHPRTRTHPPTHADARRLAGTRTQARRHAGTQARRHADEHLYCVYACMCVFIYIYIYLFRERERLCVYMSIYIYTCPDRCFAQPPACLVDGNGEAPAPPVA